MKREAKIFSITGFLSILFILFAGIGLCNADTLLDVPGIGQEQSNWCWAASAQATLQYYGTDVAQCDIVNWGWGRTDCCVRPSSADCDKGGYVGKTPDNPGKDVLGHWGVNSTYVGSALSETTVVSEIEAGRPIEIVWSLSLCPLAICDGAHAMVVFGHALNGQYIDYMDPADGEYHRNTYNWVVSSYPHTWTESFRINTSPKPNLTPYKPSTWSDKIVVSKAIGTNTDSSPLYTTDTLYVDWAVANLGNASISTTFYTRLYVDNVLKQSWYISSMPVNSYSPLTDYSIGTLSAGLHTLKIVTDATGVVAESNEGDNEYTKTITVNSASNRPPVAEAAVSKSPTGPYYGYTTPLTVTKGQSVNLYFFADKDVNGDGKASLDPDGWTNADNGVSSGGKAEWNTDLNQGTPTFERVIYNPSSAGAANIGPFTYTFNDAPGTYEYQMLRITDRKGAQSIVSKIRITVAAAPPVTPIYEGWIDGADCNSIRGWAWNKNQPNTSINVDIYDGSTKLTTVAVNVFRQDLVNAGKGNGYHGFSYATPSGLKNGGAHSVSVKYAGTSTNLSGSPKTLTCSNSVTYSMSGTIHSGSNAGSVLSGATVSIAGKTTITSSTGTFSIAEIPAGTYAFTVSKSGYDTYTNPAYYVGSNMSGLNFYLTQPTSTTGGVYGRLHDGSATGTALSGASVTCGGKSTTTGSDGSFSLSGITPANQTLSFSKTGYQSYSTGVTITAGQNYNAGDRWLVININPTIAQTPMSAPSGTTFSEWGTGFTPNSTATLHFRKPDGTEYPTASQSIKSDGSFSITYTAPTSKAPGTYTWWAVDGPTGKVSNSVSYTITVKPVIAQTPMSGPLGTTFSEWGTGFTANSTATLHFRKPDGTEYPTASQTINSNGTFSISYTTPSNKPKGTYSWWGVDGPTGKVSNTVSYTIN